MSAATSGRPIFFETTEPRGHNYGTPIVATAQFITNGLVAQNGDGVVVPYDVVAFPVTGSTVIGVYADADVLVTPTNPMPQVFANVQFGTCNMANDSGSPVLSTTLPNTLLYAVDNQTVSLSSNGNARAPVGRLFKLTSDSDFPVIVSGVGLIPSGTTV